ncbi:MAG: 16S rRNA (cytosine(1402)-N(4))-methyltransferase RsmH [Oscillospiraceae bacterium]|nr:16S rRNA (cytosine(1402)-N(4))-methyltransferase RsmH [Oscillospiraceae bacterium]
MSEFHHVTVLLNETVQAVRPQPGGVYLDGTAGGGGHSALLLQRMQGQGTLLAFDRDPDAIAHLQARFANEPVVQLIHANFFEAAQHVTAQVNGIILDLGVSSHQLDTDSRGFSYHREAPLDMRMSQSGTSAADLVNTMAEHELADMLFTLAQEKFSRRIARAIVAARPIHTTTQLAEIIANAVPAAARREGHPARKTFMALRYACNGELDGLEQALHSLFSLLVPGGRMAVITFNSLEDVAMKRVTKQLTAGCTCPPQFPACVCGKTPQARVPQKPMLPSQAELTQNPRARSAKLRVIEKL